MYKTIITLTLLLFCLLPREGAARTVPLDSIWAWSYIYTDSLSTYSEDLSRIAKNQSGPQHYNIGWITRCINNAINLSTAAVLHYKSARVIYAFDADPPIIATNACLIMQNSTVSINFAIDEINYVLTLQDLNLYSIRGNALLEMLKRIKQDMVDSVGEPCHSEIKSTLERGDKQ
jgi:hypothetical protein